jgi:hypothetical protein
MKYAALSRLIVKSNPAVQVYQAVGIGSDKPEDATTGKSSTAIMESQGAHGVWSKLPSTNSPHGMVAAADKPLSSNLDLTMYVLLGAVYMNQNMRDNSQKMTSSNDAVREQQVAKMYGVGRNSDQLEADTSALAKKIKELGEAASDSDKTAIQNEIATLMQRLYGQQSIQGTAAFDFGNPAGSSRSTAQKQAAADRRGAMFDSSWGGEKRFNRSLSSYNIVESGERVKPYIQTLHKSVGLGAKIDQESVKIKIVGTHPLIELIVAIQHDENARSTSWDNYGTVMNQCWQSAEPKGEHLGGQSSRRAGPYGYSVAAQAIDSAQNKHKADVQPKSAQGPIKTLKLLANANVRHSRAPGSHYTRLVPHIMHSNSPDEDKGAYLYSIPIALFPESCVEWTGSLNQGRLTELELEFEPVKSMKNSDISATFHVMARTWNVHSIKNDLGSPKFTNNLNIEIK